MANACVARSASDSLRLFRLQFSGSLNKARDLKTVAGFLCLRFVGDWLPELRWAVAILVLAMLRSFCALRWEAPRIFQSPTKDKVQLCIRAAQFVSGPATQCFEDFRIGSQQKRLAWQCELQREAESVLSLQCMAAPPSGGSSRKIPER